MGKTPTSSFRIAAELLERVDQYAQRLSETAGVPVSRAAAVTRLLTIALDVEESGRTKRPPLRAPRRSHQADEHPQVLGPAHQDEFRAIRDIATTKGARAARAVSLAPSTRARMMATPTPAVAYLPNRVGRTT